MRAAIAQLEAETDPRAGWNEIMRGSLLLRLRQLVDVRQDMRDLRQHIEAGGGALATPLAMHFGGRSGCTTITAWRLLSGFAATLTILVLVRVLDRHRLAGRRRCGRAGRGGVLPVCRARRSDPGAEALPGRRDAERTVSSASACSAYCPGCTISSR